jgi:hypothetical protein
VGFLIGGGGDYQIQSSELFLIFEMNSFQEIPKEKEFGNGNMKKCRKYFI